MQVEAQHAAIIWTKSSVSLTRIGSISKDWIDCAAGDRARWALVGSPNTTLCLYSRGYKTFRLCFKAVLSKVFMQMEHFSSILVLLRIHTVCPHETGCVK